MTVPPPDPSPLDHAALNTQPTPPLLAEGTGGEPGAAFTFASWPHRCTQHPYAPAIACCMRCGRKLCARCRKLDSALFWLAHCPTCHLGTSPQASTITQQQPQPSVASLRPPTQRDASQEPQKVLEWPRTFARLLTGPGKFFAGLRPEGGLLQALGFGLFWSCVPTLLGVVLYGFLRGHPHPILVLLQAQQAESGLEGPVPLPLVLALVGVAQVFVYGALYHGLLYAFGLRTGRMRLTFKIVAYALAGQAILLIPGEEIPAIFARIVTTSLLMIGLRQAYQTTFLRAALVIAIPMLLNLHVGFDVWMLIPPEE